MTRFDVVIVGAGIGGAVLALDLGRRGWRVAVLERESQPAQIARPEIIWGATPRALERYEIAEAIRTSASVRVEGLEVGAGKPWLQIKGEDFAAAGVDAFSTNPAMTRAIIAAAALATGNVELHRGIAVEHVLQASGRVTGVQAAKRAFEATLVVGDDGAASLVRASLGIPIALDVFPIEFVTAKIARWPLTPGRVRVWIQPEEFGAGFSVAGLLPWPQNEGVLLMPMRAERAKRLFEQSPETFWAALGRITPLAGALREQLVFPRDFRRVARPFGDAASYVANGAALIGDAAHPMTPAGGQGANAAIWDALALGEVADAALRAGDVSRERLVAFESLRRPANERSMSFSRLARRVFRSRRFAPFFLVPLLARTANALGWPKRSIIRSFATAFVHG